MATRTIVGMDFHKGGKQGSYWHVFKVVQTSKDGDWVNSDVIAEANIKEKNRALAKFFELKSTKKF